MVIRIPKRIKIPKLQLAEVFFLIGLFIKQFYLRASGSVQISDAVIMLSVGVLFFSGRMRLHKIDLSLIIFVAFTFLINGIYSAYYGQNLLINSIYLLYNLLTVIAFRIYIKKESFVNALSVTMKVNLLTQLAFYILGVGRYYWGAYRYQGTFNDPNQFGFFVLCCFFMLYLCSYIQKKRLHIVWYLIVSFLIIVSASKGMVLSLLVFFFFAVFQPAIASKSRWTIVLYTLFFLLGALIILFGDYLFGDIELFSVLRNLGGDSFDFLLKRFEQRTSGTGTIFDSIQNFLRDRRMLRVIMAPQYLIYGAGEGYYLRFIQYGDQGMEIHGTMVSLLYYYGIVPYSFFIGWLRNNLRGISQQTRGVYIAMILEAFTLANHRQPLFWTIFALGSLVAAKARAERIGKGET